MRIHISKLAIFALGIAYESGAAQNTKPVGPERDSRTAVRLEAHEGQTQFKLGDPVTLDLVFTSPSPGYVVITDTSPYRPAIDTVGIAPEDGWFRSHSSFRGQSIIGNTLVDLGSTPVRVSVLLNRTIAFQKQGHYEVVLTTERLRPSDTFDKLTTLETCDPCRTTNSITIEITARDESEEAPLVVSLSHQIDNNEEIPPGSELAPEQKVALSRLQTFLYVQASDFARLPGRSYRCEYFRRAAEAFTSGLIVLRCLRTHRTCYPSEYRQLTEKGLPPF